MKWLLILCKSNKGTRNSIQFTSKGGTFDSIGNVKNVIHVGSNTVNVSEKPHLRPKGALISQWQLFTLRILVEEGPLEIHKRVEE